MQLTEMTSTQENDRKMGKSFICTYLQKHTRIYTTILSQWQKIKLIVSIEKPENEI